MSKRKPHNLHARVERACRALVRTNHVAVINVGETELQWMINWKNSRIIRSVRIVNALCDYSHRWTIFAAVLCVAPSGEQYFKSREFTTKDTLMVATLADHTQAVLDEVFADCNPNHQRTRAWIAIPDDVELDPAQANVLFAAAQGWLSRAEAA
jgi:hypothetical protein